MSFSNRSGISGLPETWIAPAELYGTSLSHFALVVQENATKLFCFESSEIF